jgi:hypothetical protein
MADRIRPHSERSRHSRRRLAAAPHGEGTHDAGSKITSLAYREALISSRFSRRVHALEQKRALGSIDQPLVALQQGFSSYNFTKNKYIPCCVGRWSSVDSGNDNGNAGGYRRLRHGSRGQIEECRDRLAAGGVERHGAAAMGWHRRPRRYAAALTPPIHRLPMAGAARPGTGRTSTTRKGSTLPSGSRTEIYSPGRKTCSARRGIASSSAAPMR